jgi:hypothetical protein
LKVPRKLLRKDLVVTEVRVKLLRKMRRTASKKSGDVENKNGNEKPKPKSLSNNSYKKQFEEPPRGSAKATMLEWWVVARSGLNAITAF